VLYNFSDFLFRKQKCLIRADPPFMHTITQGPVSPSCQSTSIKVYSVDEIIKWNYPSGDENRD